MTSIRRSASLEKTASPRAQKQTAMPAKPAWPPSGVVQSTPRRLSVGLEPIEELWKDLEEALKNT